MKTTKASLDTGPTYRATVSRRRTMTLPADLRRRLGIEAGDTVEFELVGEHAIVRRASDQAVPQAWGLLRGYFKDWEDINRYVQEERQAWEDEDGDR